MIVKHFFESFERDDVIAKSKENWLAAFMLAINHAITDQELDLPRVTAATSGMDLEGTFRSLPEATQVRILYEVIVNPKNRRLGVRSKDAKEDAILRRETRQFKLFQFRFIKTILWSLFAGFILLISMSVYLAISSAKAPDSDLISSILKTITELLKIIFST